MGVTGSCFDRWSTLSDSITSEKYNALERKFTIVETNNNTLHTKYSVLESKFDTLCKRFDAMTQRIDHVEKKASTMFFVQEEPECDIVIVH